MYARNVYSGINVKSSICVFSFFFVRVCVLFNIWKKGLVKQNLLNGLKTEEE